MSESEDPWISFRSFRVARYFEKSTRASISLQRLLTQRDNLYEDEFEENSQGESLVVPKQKANGYHDYFQHDVFKKAKD